MNEINLGSIKIPINAATKTFAILAKRGAGKTYTGAVMAEELAKNNVPFIVFDPIDVWWGLRLDKNGSDKGLPVVVFGLQHHDILLDRDMGRKIAQAIVRENISCVISTFGMPKTAQRYLISEFSEELLNINNTPRHVFIEEAHEFVPQRVFGGLGKTFNAVSNLVVMGRNRGIGVTLINQRAATLNKDVLTQLDTLLAFQNVSPQDRKALKEWVEFHAAEGDFEKFMASLPSLPKGEGWIWSPEFLGIFERIKIRKRETFHPDREKMDEEFSMPLLDQTDIQAFISKFAKSVEPKSKKDKSGKSDAGKAIAPEPQNLIALRNEYESRLLQKDVEIRKLQATIDQVRGILGGTTNGSAPMPTYSPGSNLQFWIDKAGRGGEGKILKFLAEKSPSRFTRAQIGFATGLTPTSGSFATYLSNLKGRSLIIEENKLLWLNPEI
jgi:hypothetical protein